MEFQVCAVCGERHGVTFGFRSTLARNGIKGDKATIECIGKLPKSPERKVIPIRPRYRVEDTNPGD
jgi:hypothetical protein